MAQTEDVEAKLIIGGAAITLWGAAMKVLSLALVTYATRQQQRIGDSTIEQSHAAQRHKALRIAEQLIDFIVESDYCNEIASRYEPVQAQLRPDPSKGWDVQDASARRSGG